MGGKKSKPKNNPTNEPTNQLKSKYQPKSQSEENIFFEGYWAKDQNPAKDEYKGKYPWPVPSSFPEKQVFLENLAEIERHLYSLQDQSRGNFEEKYVISYRGLSECRLCNKLNGSKEFVLKNSGQNINWPEGYQHYVKDHDIKPSDKFLQIVMNFKK